MKTHAILIKQFSDYKTKFGDVYCHKRNIIREFHKDRFLFYFEDDTCKSELLIGYKQIEEYYRDIIDIKPIILININNSQDYSLYYDNYVSISETGCFVKNEYKNFTFQFRIFCSPNNKINEFLIHNYVLLCYKMIKTHPWIRLDIICEEGIEQEKNDIARITTYVSDCIPEIKKSISFNKKELFHKEMNIGKLFPAMYIDREMLNLLRTPITSNIWDKIVNSPKISFDTFSEEPQDVYFKKHWFLFQVCKKYLFSEFDGNKSKKYTEMRNATFANDKFKSHVLKIPFLALILFAQYDCFYRSSLLKEYKKKSGKVQLNWNDFIVNLQETQSYDTYCKYKKMCETDDDIKTLIKFKTYDKSSVVPDFSQDNVFIHEKIISELFEATTIAEGLLQLLENAVEHAQGGLLSIRIRENKDQDRDYLVAEYNQYFKKIKLVEVAKFYLEIKISDVSALNIKKTFLNNIKLRGRENNDLSAWYNEYHGIFDENDRIYELFFDPDYKVKAAWEKYYEISDNQVHHFGLQIFDSIITAKNGLFHISGHDDVYSSRQYDIDNDKKIEGTSYRILLPINQNYREHKNIIVDTMQEKWIDFERLDLYKNNEKYMVYQPNWIEILSIIGDYETGKEKKETAISKISASFTNNCKRNHLLWINYQCLNESANYVTELIVKGIMLFLLRNGGVPHPIAMVNLPSHTLLEICRIIALFYDKNGQASNSMRNVQIYLKGNDVGEEILFCGNNINKSADRLRRIAMTRGIMFDYWQVAHMLMCRSKNMKKESYYG